MATTNRALRVVGEGPSGRGPTTLVDSCVLFDLVLDDPAWGQWSATALAAAADEGPLVINPVVHARVSVGFDSVEVLDSVLPAADCLREELPFAGGLSGRQGVFALPQARRCEDLPAAGLLHRRPRGRVGPPAAHP